MAETPRQLKTNRLLFWLTLLLVVAILGGAGYGAKWYSARQQERQKAAQGRRDDAVTVSTAIVTTADLQTILTFNGDVEALQTVKLQPKIPGRLLKLELEDGTPVEEGVVVQKGQLIGQLDDREYVAQLDIAKAALAAAEAALAVAKSDLEEEKANYASCRAATDNAQANYDDKAREQKRMAGLVASNAATQQSLDQANTALAQASAQLNQATANVQGALAKIASAEADIQRAAAAFAQAQAGLETAELNLAETRIYSPMRGVVSEKLADPGAMLSSSTPIVTIVSIATVKVVIAVPVNHLSRVIPGQTHATLTTPALPGREIDCVVEKIYPTVDTVTRTAQVEFRVKNERDEASGAFVLRPGVYASVAVLLEERRDVVAIDLSLPVRNLDRELMFVCHGDVVEAVPVKLGTTFRGLVEVEEGLQPGDEIVVQGQHRLTDGSRIHRVQSEAASEK
ncbi:MAG: efflux RND transporter periplasmic adaptor subunit [Victivallales bacterium]|nr:efflux RND transporter periplasmic adaptor subunit [Victivallales bacterium]